MFYPLHDCGDLAQPYGSFDDVIPPLPDSLQEQAKALSSGFQKFFSPDLSMLVAKWFIVEDAVPLLRREIKT